MDINIIKMARICDSERPTNSDNSKITMCCDGTRAKHNNFIWSYCALTKEELKIKILSAKRLRFSRIDRKNVDGCVINSYKSFEEMCEFENIKSDAGYLRLNNKLKRTSYIWQMVS